MIKEYQNMQIIVSVSGGKDSTAMCLNLLKQGYTQNDFTRIFADTGWEHKTTYTYLDYLEQYIGPIIRLKQNIPKVDKWADRIDEIENLLGFTSPMVRRIYQYELFASGVVKWCTPVLKLKPIHDYLNTLNHEIVQLVGIRAAESERRSHMLEWEFNSKLDCYTHRPLLNWSEKEVIDIHHEFNILPNNLYLNGAHRVGCWPCIYSNKSEIFNLDQDRIDIIRMIENDLNATFFKGRCIDDVAQWAKTKHGGKQYFLFSPYEPTCEKWGLCGI